MLKKYLELLKKGIDSFSSLGKNGNWHDYFNTVRLEFIILAIGVAIIVGIILLCVVPFFYNKFTEKKAMQLSKYGIWQKIENNYISYKTYLSCELSNIANNVHELELGILTHDNRNEIVKIIKKLSRKNKNDIRIILKEVLDYLKRNEYDTINIENIFSMAPDSIEETEAIADILVKITDILTLKLLPGQIIEKFATNEEKVILGNTLAIIKEKKSTDFLKKKYNVYKGIMLTVFYILYAMFIIPLIMMLF